jgi:hypothetical protein
VLSDAINSLSLKIDRRRSARVVEVGRAARSLAAGRPRLAVVYGLEDLDLEKGRRRKKHSCEM